MRSAESATIVRSQGTTVPPIDHVPEKGRCTVCSAGPKKIRAIDWRMIATASDMIMQGSSSPTMGLNRIRSSTMPKTALMMPPAMTARKKGQPKWPNRMKIARAPIM